MIFKALSNPLIFSNELFDYIKQNDILETLVRFDLGEFEQ